MTSPLSYTDALRRAQRELVLLDSLHFCREEFRRKDREANLLWLYVVASAFLYGGFFLLGCLVG